MNKYEVLADFNNDELGAHTAGSTIESPANETILQLIEDGIIKMIESLESSEGGTGTGIQTDQGSSQPAQEEDKLNAPLGAGAQGPIPTAPSQQEQQASATHEANMILASSFPAAPSPFDGKTEGIPQVPAMLYSFCVAIEHHEVYAAPGADARWPNGTRAFHDKNPGNLRYAQQIGSIAEDKDGFAMFPTYEAGFMALVRQVELAIKGNGVRYKSPVWDALKKLWRPSNFYDFFKVYDSSFGDNPTAYAEDVAAEMSKVCGKPIAPDTALGALIA